jgi:hypothetical protein
MVAPIFRVYFKVVLWPYGIKMKTNWYWYNLFPIGKTNGGAKLSALILAPGKAPLGHWLQPVQGK